MDTLFRKRVGIPENEDITFASLDMVLERTAQFIPFENLALMEKRTKSITKANLVEKILVNNEGGLCYDLNLILYFFLIENGFNAVLTEAIIYNNENQKFRDITGLHLIILLTHEKQIYLLDAGYGGKVPLKPVPFTGNIVSSSNGEFRIKQYDTTHGDFVLEMKLKDRDTEWQIGYAIDTNDLINDISELDETQKIMIEHEKSPFNKGPIITRIVAGGYLALTENTFTQFIDGEVTKEKIDQARFKQLLQEHFGLQNSVSPCDNEFSD